MILDSIESAPEDRRIAYNIDGSVYEHLFTLGRGTYIHFGTNIKIFLENFHAPNVLIGRFSSIADKMTLLLGGNHPYTNVSCFPFDVKNIVEKNFGDIKPISNIRPNHLQIIVGHDVWIG